MKERSRRMLGLVVTLLVIVLGVMLRFLIAMDQSHFVWLDELHTAWVVSGDFSDVLPRATIGNQSPLFFWYEYVCTSGSELNGVRLRLPVVLLSLATLLVIPWVVYSMTRSWYAILIALCIACLDSTWVFYSTEARPFAAVQLFALVQFWFFYRIYVAKNQTGWPVHLGLILSTAILFYLHYTTILFLTIQWSYVLVLHFTRTKCPNAEKASGQTKNRLPYLLVHTVLILPIVAPGLRHVFSIADAGDQWASFATAEAFIDSMNPIWLCYLLLPAILVTTCWFLQSFQESAKNPLIDFSGIDWKLPLVLFAGPILLALVLSGIPKPDGKGPVLAVGHLRYVISAIAIAPVFVATIVAGLKHTAARFVAVCVIGVSVLVFNQSFHELLGADQLSALRAERWGMISSQINTRSRDTQTIRPVFLCSNLVEDDRLANTTDDAFLDYCRFPLSNRLIRLRKADQAIVPIATFVLPRFHNIDHKRVAAEGGCFLVVRGDELLLEEIANELADYLSSRKVEVIATGRIQMPQSNVYLLEFETR